MAAFCAKLLSCWLRAAGQRGESAAFSPLTLSQHSSVDQERATFVGTPGYNYILTYKEREERQGPAVGGVGVEGGRNEQ